jgi:hypothetical protein
MVFGAARSETECKLQVGVHLGVTALVFGNLFRLGVHGLPEHFGVGILLSIPLGNHLPLIYEGGHNYFTYHRLSLSLIFVLRLKPNSF